MMNPWDADAIVAQSDAASVSEIREANLEGGFTGGGGNPGHLAPYAEKPVPTRPAFTDFRIFSFPQERKHLLSKPHLRCGGSGRLVCYRSIGRDVHRDPPAVFLLASKR